MGSDLSLLGSAVPVLGHENTREMFMSTDESIQIEGLEIADLEYDVGGMGAEEAAGSRDLPGYIVVMIVPPK